MTLTLRYSSLLLESQKYIAIGRLEWVCCKHFPCTFVTYVTAQSFTFNFPQMIWKPIWHPLPHHPYSVGCGCLIHSLLLGSYKNLEHWRKGVVYDFLLPAGMLKWKPFILKLKIRNWKCWVDSSSVLKTCIFGQVFWIIFVVGFIRHYCGTSVFGLMSKASGPLWLAWEWVSLIYYRFLLSTS